MTISFIDEVVKGLLPGREFDFIDMRFDLIGYDAIEVGFNHVVFIIRKDIEKEFKEVIGDRIASICACVLCPEQKVARISPKL